MGNLPWTVESREAASIIHARRSPWREESEARLRVLFDGGLSHAEMAEQLNAEFGMVLTRNATIGKCHRMGLQRVALPGKAAGQRKSTKQKTPRASAHRAIVKIVAANGNSNHMRVIRARTSADELRLRCVEIECTTPFADVTGCWYPSEGTPPLWCNGKRQEGSSFCTAHHALVWMPARPSTTPGWRAAA